MLCKEQYSIDCLKHIRDCLKELMTINVKDNQLTKKYMMCNAVMDFVCFRLFSLSFEKGKGVVAFLTESNR